MKKIYTFIALAAAIALTSCNTDELIPEGGNKVALTIGRLGINEIATKAVAEEDSATVYESDCCGTTFTVTEEVTPICNPRTKASIMTGSELRSFVLDGYITEPAMSIMAVADESETDTTDLHFINNVKVTYDGSDNEWHTDGEYTWRNMANHHFWAYYGNVSNFSITEGSKGNQYGKATFNYSNTGEEDVLVANNIVYWKEGDNSALQLQFDHALSAVSADMSGVKMFVKSQDGTTRTEDASRGTVNDVKIVSYNDGICTVDNGFTWVTAMTKSGELTALPVMQSPGFVIPQEKSYTRVVMTVTDNVRTFTRDYELNLGWNGLWLAGDKYNYKISGNVAFPYVDKGVSGIDLTFDSSTKQQDYKVVIDDLKWDMVKRIKLSWDGAPKANGNGTVTMICLVPYTASYTPDYSTYFSGNGNLTINSGRSDVGFAFKSTGSSTEVIKGTLNEDHCECVFDLDDIGSESVNRYMLVALFNGGNKSNHVTWITQNMKLEIVEWR